MARLSRCGRLAAICPDAPKPAAVLPAAKEAAVVRAGGKCDPPSSAAGAIRFALRPLYYIPSDSVQ